MKKNIHKIPQIFLDNIIKTYSHGLSSCATIPLPNYFPLNFNFLPYPIRKRNSSTNEFLGTTITNPNPNSNLEQIIFGESYFDKKDKKKDEDYYLINLIGKTIESIPPYELKKRFPHYKNTHHGNKDYLETS